MTPAEKSMLKIMTALADHLELRSDDVEVVRRLIAADDDISRREAEALRNWNRVVVFGPEQKGVQGE